MIGRPHLDVDGESTELVPGETVLEAASRTGADIPTLCHDPRLAPVGACRTCLVEIEGQRRLMPACTTPAVAGMTVRTTTERVARHRSTLFSLYLTDHPHDREASEKGAPDQLLDMAERYGANWSWGRMEPVRAARPDDANPYIHFNPDTCILCSRC